MDIRKELNELVVMHAMMGEKISELQKNLNIKGPTDGRYIEKLSAAVVRRKISRSKKPTNGV